MGPLSARRAASRRAAKVQRRQRTRGDGIRSVAKNADRARKRAFCRRFGASGKRYRALEHDAKRNGVA